MLLISLESSGECQIAPVTELLARSDCRWHELFVGDSGRILAEANDGSERSIADELRKLRGVKRVVKIETPNILSARQAFETRTVVPIGPNLLLGADEFVVMAGPCAVEDYEQTRIIADGVKSAGAKMLRGGAFKPRTSPFSFQGLGRSGLDILTQVRSETGLPIVSELMDQREIETVTEAVDLIQIGMRNSLNYALLRDVGRLKNHKPVLLKCGVGTTIDEFLCAADHLLCGGNDNLVLCLRGTIGISRESRACLNVADIPALRLRTHLPIIVDPSHAAGRWEFVPAIAAAAIVAGADGLLVEVHNNPKDALSDGGQSLSCTRFKALMHRLRLLAAVMGRTFAATSVSDCCDNIHPFADLFLEPPPIPGAKPWSMHEHSVNLERTRS